MVAKKFSKVWKSSTQARKQRKYVYNAPLHLRHKMVASSLSKELRKTHGVRSVPVRTGDFVTIMSGQFKGKSGKVVKVSLARMVAFVEGAENTRSDGTKSLYPIHPSNLMITKLDLSDKQRSEKLERVKSNK